MLREPADELAGGSKNIPLITAFEPAVAMISYLTWPWIF
jgi:hypothetical protein